MDRRDVAGTVARNIRSAISATGNTIAGVAEATTVAASKINADPSAGELTVNELAAVGGFLHVAPSSFFEGAQP